LPLRGRPQAGGDVRGPRLQVRVYDQNLGAGLDLRADYLVLAAAVRPNPGSDEIARIFKLPFDLDGFFLEAHLKLRPLDFAANGIFLCGLAHSPKYADEAVPRLRGLQPGPWASWPRKKCWWAAPSPGW